MTTQQTALPSAPAPPEPDGEGPPPRRRWWRPDLLTTVGVLAFVLFALGTVGSPLWGGSVLAATDELQVRSPYQDVGLVGIPVQNSYMDDTFNAVMPDTLLFAGQVKVGHVAAWNPYVVGGVPLGAIPTLGLANPLTLPYYLLPDSLAPGYVKLLETVFCGAMTFLFLRRLRLGRPAAVLGGLVFASSAFMVVWTNWPHTRTAAFIPAVFWAVERFVQRRRVRDAALISLAVGGMLAGGFPAVTAFTLFTAAPYLVVRAVAAYPGQLRRVLGVLAGAAAGLAGAAALLAFQLLPFVRAMSDSLIAGREQQPGEHLAAASLITTIAPWALGTVTPSDPPQWYLPVNLIESMSYVGAAGLVLVVVALAVPWAARAFLPRGTWAFLVAALGLWVVVIYTGPGAGLAHHLPVFSTNFVGRARSVVWLLIAALAAVGLEVVLRRRKATSAGGERRWHAWYAAGVTVASALFGAVVFWQARQATRAAPADALQRTERTGQLDEQVLIGAMFLALTVAAVALAWWSGGRREPLWARVRLGAAATLPVLAAVQALTLTVPYLPRVDKDTFYPVTDTHRYLMEHLGHDRFAGTWTAMYAGADSQLQLRGLSGHQFVDQRFAELVQGLPTRQFDSPTWLDLPSRADVATSPVLDRLGVRYFVASPSDRVFGRRTPVPTGGSPITAIPGTPGVPRLTVEEPLRAVVVTPVGPLPPRTADAAVEAVLKDPAGREVARSRRLASGLAEGKPFDFPVAAEDVPAGTELTVEFTATGLGGPLSVAGTLGRVALGTVTGAGDGLRLVRSTPAVVYERLDAAPRIRWASEAFVEPDGAARVDREASGTLRPDQVVLDTAGPPAEGAPADLRIDEDGTDRIEVSVSAQGAGYLVIADAIQGQFKATVDGKAVDLVPADHGLAAVAVPAGQHVVRVQYAAPYANLGGWVSMLMVIALLTVVVTGRVRDRRRSASEGIGADRRGQIVTSR
ncbi:hypothetical protein RB614_30435 [Phytohabitans sp. ZYX-F-186]|uniref:YfhO family protein n=1 Tax=Phytohabitans maris TaxID=3071409 RepID=A0ABU0ZR93_9ACTN|nr:hypothetical protein [Phytohabitans sp. ZYX-F-186]MDQ7908859.1 hypothetical protein [Phytohabitans sp. ZYX-F-186]